MYVPLFDEIREFLYSDLEHVEYFCIANIIAAVFFLIYFTKRPLQIGPLVYQQGFPTPKILLSDKICYSLTNIIPIIFFVYFCIIKFEPESKFLTVPTYIYVFIHLFRGTIGTIIRSKHSAQWPIHTFIFILIQRIMVAVLASLSVTIYLYAYKFNFIIMILLAIILVAFSVQVKQDFYLTNLRFVGPKGYRPLSGGIYNYIACPSYFMELIIWIIWGLIFKVNLATISIWIWLTPTVYKRAVNRHKWLHRTFKGKIPASQTPIIPFINVGALVYTLIGTLEYGW